MQTRIQKITDVEYELRIEATADDLSGDLNKAVKEQRSKTKMKGFRPGKVPASMVRKMYGKALAYGVAEDLVQKTFQSEVLGSGEYDVMGQPTITELDYEYEGDLEAAVRFGVRPTIELADLSGKTVMRLSHEVTDEEVDKEMDALRARQAELVPVDGPAEADSYVIVDIQRLDADSGTPIIGEKDEGAAFLLSDENLMPELKEAIIGLSADETATATFKAPQGDEERSYEITLREVKRRELPEWDEELVGKITDGKVDDADELRTEVHRQIESGWEQRRREMFETEVVDTLIDAHEFEVPESVVEMYQDAFLRELKSRNDDQLPEGFDVEGFKESRREEAEKQARWMFIRDAFVKEHGLEVTDDDRDAHFESMAGDGGLDAAMLRRYYENMPNMLDRLDQRLLTEKVFALLEEQLTVEEKDLDAYQDALKEGEAEGQEA
ncbi:MAG: trigger factor [Rhodothermales bacterium]|nr:trigger factor [Rhodothermales bacterium]